MRIPVRDEFGRQVGSTEDGVFYTSRLRYKHFYRNFESYGISVYVLEKVRERGVLHVCIQEYREGGPRYLYSSLDDWFASGLDYTDPTHNRDQQKHIPVSKMRDELGDAIRE